MFWLPALHTLEGLLLAACCETNGIGQGPVASQEVIKLLSSDGGGFFNANSAHPFENPTALSNLVQMVLIVLIGAALTNLFGRMVGDERQGWAIFAAMGLLFLARTTLCYWSEAAGNPALTALGGLVPLTNIMLGETIFGGVGSGLYGMLLYIIVAMFIAGLMVGRTPEYAGKKLEAKVVKMTMLALLCVPLVNIGLTAVAVAIPAGVAGVANSGPHGFTEILYAYVSAAGNNGSAFAGLSANRPARRSRSPSRLL